jgi:outer membrane murein-binding lipoprotein Lpp
VRLLLGLAGVVVLAGCGTMAGRSGAPAAPAAPVADAPPIEAVDEAPPPQVQDMLDAEFAPLPADFGEQVSGTSSSAGAGSFTMVYSYSSGIDTLSPDGTASTTTKPTAAQIAQLRSDIEARRTAIEPATGAPPRVVARLPLADGGEVLFLTWHNRGGLLCTTAQIVDAHGGGGGGASGPCAGAGQGGTPCAAICLSSDETGDATAQRWVLTGTVAADADAVDVTTGDGTTLEYPLTGPVVDGDRRVFLLELGAQDWRKLALLQGGQVEAEAVLPAMIVASEDCNVKLGPMPPPTPPAAPGPVTPSPAEHAYVQAFQDCMTASGALPAFPASPVPTP